MDGILFAAAEVLFVAVLAAVYFLPLVIAIRRHHRNIVAVLVVTILTAWTVIGWFGVLAWALLGEREGEPLVLPPDAPET